jgi:lysophospholipase L1-like esterase
MRKHGFAIAVLLAGCSTSGPASTSKSDASATGGTHLAGTGGQAATGGGTGSGGAVSTGGVTATGGISATGGTPASGGVTGTGGETPTDAAAAGTGGSTGGTSATGGRPGTGGASGTGGGAGGVHGTGGSTTAAADAGSDARDAGGAERAPDALVSDARDTPAGVTATDVAPSAMVTVYVAGDSTVSTYTGSSIHQAGWGQFLQDYFVANAKIVNKAVGGMTARHFIEAGYLDAILGVIKPGDYLLVQFGTNDGNSTATYTLPGVDGPIPYYLDPQTDFKTYLAKYVDATKAKSATTIFVTPPPRHSCNAGETGVRNGLAAYATAMKELGPTLGTEVVDLNAMVIAYLADVTCETSGSTFYLVKADGTTDSTHFQENGADVMAGLVANGTSGISTLGLPLSAYVK